MSKDDRSPINPFTGKEHYDSVDDDKFLEMVQKSFYEDIENYELLDNTVNGLMVFNVASRLIQTVEDFLKKIGRYDYVEDYYEWEFHLLDNDVVNAYCAPGGKIVFYSGIFQIVKNEEQLAFILAHEMSHALLDHGRTKISVQQTKDNIAAVSFIGSFALDLMGFGDAGNITRTAIGLAEIGSHFFLTQPWGRDHEYEADKLGMILIHLAGYDVSIVPDFWYEFTKDDGNTFDFFSTHPSDEKRLAVMRESLHGILNETDFYSKPVLPETPSPKDEYKVGDDSDSVPQIDYPSAPQTTFEAPVPKIEYPSIPESSFENPISQTTFEAPVSSDSSVSESSFEDSVSTTDSSVSETSFEDSAPQMSLETPNVPVGVSAFTSSSSFNKEKCSRCGNVISSNDKFCMVCGNKIERINPLACPECGYITKPGDKFCLNCGYKLTKDLYCSQCGKKVIEGQKFCSECGNRL